MAKYYNFFRSLIITFISVIIVLFVNNELIYEWGDIVNSILNKHRYFYLNRPSAYMPPLYPILIAIFKTIFSSYGVNILHATLFSATYYIFTNLLVEILAILGLSSMWEVEKTKLIILITPLAFFFYPPVAFGYFNVSVFPVSTFLFISYMYLLALIYNNPKFKYFFFIGLVAGLLTLARSEFYYVGFAILVIYLALLYRGINKQILHKILGYLLGLLIVVGPWLIRNKVELGEPVLSTAKYYNLWRGNNLVESTIPITPESYYKNVDLYGSFTEVEEEKFLKTEFEKYVKENQTHFAFGVLKKMRNYFFSYYPKKTDNDFYHGSLFHYLFIPWSIILLITFVLFIRDKLIRTNPFFLTLIASYLIYTCIHGLTQVLPRYNLQNLIIFIVIIYSVYLRYRAKLIYKKD
jgi:4-amino-4-deoxy-L-arabinose transferase-like glycosyltransferase